MGALAFSAAYVWLVMIWAALRRTPLEYALALVLVVDAVALTLWSAAGGCGRGGRQ